MPNGQPAQLANLNDPWPPGVSGNPRGRPNLGLSVNEWRNVLGERTKGEVQAMLDNPRSTAAQLMAASEVMKAVEGDLHAIAQACNFTSGKPKQAVDVTHYADEPRTEAEREAKRDRVLARIRARLAQSRPATGNGEE
jgi:hypothetical protein